MRILGIETSCDETAAAVVEDGRVIRSNVVATQFDIHAEFGGIVPEIASRQHLLTFNAVARKALRQAGLALRDVDGIAVTYGPGLAGSLLVGVNAAKGLAMAENKRLVGINHLEGHIYAAWLEDIPDPALEPGFPLLCLIASGGHTELVVMRDHGRYELVGQTRDDAAGEAFDKAARVLGLGFPGGPAIQNMAARPRHAEPRFPRPRVKDSLDFSFSGLKTAMMRRAAEKGWDALHGPEIDERELAGVAGEFQEAVVDSIVTRCVEAAKAYRVNGIMLGGGVAANTLLREEAARRAPVPVIAPRPGLCTDNGAMIAAAGWRYLADSPDCGLGLDVVPSLRLG